MAASEGMGGEPGYARCGPAKLYEKSLRPRENGTIWFPIKPHTVLTAGYDAFSCNVGKFEVHVSEDRDSLMARAFGRYPKVFGHWIHNK